MTSAVQRDLGAIFAKLETIADDIADGTESRRRIHERLDDMAPRLVKIERDVHDIDARLKKVEKTAADINRWRERGIGAYMLIIGISASIGGFVVTYGKKIWIALTGS